MPKIKISELFTDKQKNWLLIGLMVLCIVLAAGWFFSSVARSGLAVLNPEYLRSTAYDGIDPYNPRDPRHQGYGECILDFSICASNCLGDGNGPAGVCNIDAECTPNLSTCFWAVSISQ